MTNRNKYNYQYVEKQPREICINAIEQKSPEISYVANRTKEEQKTMGKLVKLINEIPEARKRARAGYEVYPSIISFGNEDQVKSFETFSHKEIEDAENYLRNEWLTE